MKIHKILLIFALFFCVFINAQNEFITVWKPGSSTEIKFPGRGTNFSVAWEEIGYPNHNGTLTIAGSNREFIINIGNSFNPTPANATYKVKISNGNGHFDQIRFFDSTISPVYTNLQNAEKIIEISQWGNMVWQSMSNAFVFCTNLDVTAVDTPNLSQITETDWMFYGCNNLVGNASFNNWDTSSLTSLYYMFGDTNLFNAPLGNWNVSNVTDFSYLFDMAQNFNQPLANWDVSNATGMVHMFHGAAAFNQPIGNWNTAKVTSMEEMFHAASSFNQYIGEWDTGNVTTMYKMFENAIVFNQNIRNWNTAQVQNMNGMFKTAFKFNQNLSSWNTANVQNMGEMFYVANTFNQNLGSWNLASLTVANDMLFGANLSCQNYDQTLYGWNQNLNTPNNITLSSATALVYSNPLALSARFNLITGKNWTITGDTYNPSCPSTILNISETTRSEDFYIYPNPTSDFLNIETKLKIEEAKILDLSGRIVLNIKNPSNKINVSKLSSGNHILQLISKEGSVSFNFMKK